MLWLLRSMSYATLDDLCDRTLPARHPADNMHACIQASDSHMAPNRDVYGRSTADVLGVYGRSTAEVLGVYGRSTADVLGVYGRSTADVQQTYCCSTADPQQPTQYIRTCMHADDCRPSGGRLPCAVPTAPGPCSHLVVASLVMCLLRLAPAAISWSPSLCCTYCAWPLPAPPAPRAVDPCEPPPPSSDCALVPTRPGWPARCGARRVGASHHARTRSQAAPHADSHACPHTRDGSHARADRHTRADRHARARNASRLCWRDRQAAVDCLLMAQSAADIALMVG